MREVNSRDLLSKEISYFQNVRCVEPSKGISIQDFLCTIQSQKLEREISEIRKANEKERRKKKQKLPCVSLSGLGNRSRIKKAGSFKHSGLLQLDFDVKDQKISSERIKGILKSDPHVLACFYSPSGGVKAIVPILEEESSHYELFNMAKKHFMTVYAIVADESPKSPNALCYLSHDPQVYIADGEVKQFEPADRIKNQSNSFCITHSKHSIHSNSAIQKKGGEGEREISGFEKLKNKKLIKTEEQKWKNDPSTPSWLIEMWELIERRFVPNLSERNKILCQFIPFAHRRMSKLCAMEIALIMRKVWDCVCTDPINQHMREAESLWIGCEKTFVDQLNPIESEYYDELHGSLEYLQPCFRICRDLAYYENEKTKKGELFLSCRELGVRLGVSHKTASLYLKELVEYEIIKVTSLGRMKNRMATKFNWMLGLSSK